MNAIDLETRYCAHNYEPLPVVLARGKGATLWDTAGRRGAGRCGRPQCGGARCPGGRGGQRVVPVRRELDERAPRFGGGIADLSAADLDREAPERRSLVRRQCRVALDMLTLANGTSSSSATICPSAVHTPAPRSTLPV